MASGRQGTNGSVDRRCPACGASATAPWRVAHAVRGGRPAEELPLLRCEICGTAWPAEATPPAEALYASGAYAAAPAAERVHGLAALLDRDRLRLIGPLPPRARVIEVGAGRGRLVAALRSRGVEATGIEPHPRRGGPAPNVVKAAVEDAEFEAGGADAIVFWHSLEHLDDPHAALARATGWLRRGGRAVVAVPNLASLQARIGGDRWLHQDLPRHRTLFTLGGLRELMRRSGLRPGRAHQLMLEQNVLGMWLTLLNGLTAGRDVPYRALKRDLSYERRLDALRDALVCVMAGVPLLPLAAVAEAAAGLAGRAGSVVAHGTRG